MTARLVARGLRAGYGGRVVVDGLDLDLPAGRVTAVVGPNGCGKSTMLRALGRILPVQAGAVLLDGRPLHRMRPRDVARALAVLPQTPVAPEGLSVADLVARGRHPHRSWLRQWSAADEEAVARALHRTNTTALAARPVEELSGGQRQRVWVAMVLAQEADVLLLDEPTTYLDLAHAVEVLDLVAGLAADDGRTVVVVLHDLNLAARFADRLVVLHAGAVAAQGVPGDVLTPRLLADVFGLDAVVVPDPVAGTPLVVPTATRRTRTAPSPVPVAVPVTAPATAPVAAPSPGGTP